MEGLEPTHLAALDPKSSVSTNFTTSACDNSPLSVKSECKSNKKNNVLHKNESFLKQQKNAITQVIQEFLAFEKTTLTPS